MTIDPQVNETWPLLLKEGGAIAALIVVLFIIKALVPLFPKKNGKFTEYQRLQVIEIVRVAVEEMRLTNETALADLRNLITKRTELIREVIRDELKERRTFIRSDHPEPYTGEERRRK